MRKLTIFTLCLILIGCSTIFDEKVQSAEKAFAAGNFSDALVFYEEAIELKEDDVIEELISSLLLFEQLEEFIEAEEWVEAEIKLEELDNRSIPRELAEVVAEKDELVNKNLELVN